MLSVPGMFSIPGCFLLGKIESFSRRKMESQK